MEASVKYVKEMSLAVRGLAQKSKQGIPDRKESSSIAAWYNQIEDQLNWLENDARMTVELKNLSQIDKVLPLMFADERFHFTGELSERSRVLFERFESERWGAPAPADTDVEMVDASASLHRSPERTSRSNSDRTIKYPPANHPIWGIHGIMHGIALSIPRAGQPGKPEYKTDLRYETEIRDGKVYGDNEIVVGSWWPKKLVAKFHGAHEMHGSGIAGSRSHGAYSIVVSGAYSDVDEDHGSFLYYSAPQSGEHADPATTKTSTELEMSCRYRRPVRVLRSAGTSRWSPRCGLRYDGLYEVTSMQRKINKLKGSYNRFTLERLDDQDDIDLSRPNRTEVLHNARIKDKF
ncbi:hypothetical protein LTR56_001692 [Elasticomyces elasticus]|nr:hypothetical protein LTR56_001692 [Elasticomyces elasticus]KAK3667257.1 hypothetical protein LTR22_001773 [Elasticomyces elasticus]KAK4932665.1 hypothetical protein LTR49_001089 [Elasticomyces elasticus]KAK5769686.1 hypothetical protein LTS12_000136 [Elasticomyces elasticus]